MLSRILSISMFFQIYSNCSIAQFPYILIFSFSIMKSSSLKVEIFNLKVQISSLKYEFHNKNVWYFFQIVLNSLLFCFATYYLAQIKPWCYFLWFHWIRGNYCLSKIRNGGFGITELMFCTCTVYAVFMETTNTTLRLLILFHVHADPLTVLDNITLSKSHSKTIVTFFTSFNDDGIICVFLAAVEKGVQQV